MKLIKQLILVPCLLVLTSCFDDQIEEQLEKQSDTLGDAFKYLAFSSSSIRVEEGTDAEASFDLIYSGNSLGTPLTVAVSIIAVDGNNAVEGTDYSSSAALNSFTFQPGEFIKEISLGVLDNQNSVGTRKLKLQIDEIAGFDLGSPGSPETAAVTVDFIEDDQTILGFSSFEEVDLSGRSNEYTKSGTTDLNNNPGEAPVDFVATGNELGFDSSFDPANVGDDGGELIGVGSGITDLSIFDSDIPSTPFSYTDGNQAYHASDLDGTLEIAFDEVTFPGGVVFIEFSLAVYLGAYNGDEGEGVELVWRAAGEEDVVLFNIADGTGESEFSYGDDISFPTNAWETVRVTPDPSTISPEGQVVIRITNDNNEDPFFVDALSIAYIN